MREEEEVVEVEEELGKDSFFKKNVHLNVIVISVMHDNTKKQISPLTNALLKTETRIRNDLLERTNSKRTIKSRYYLLLDFQNKLISSKLL